MDSTLEKTLSSMILSASGWRGVFAENGDEESAAGETGAAHRLIARTAAEAFDVYLKNLGRQGGVIVSRDTRPTGKVIADEVIEALLAEGREVFYPGIAAVPEIMAYARSFDKKPGGAAGFIYISASHNPIGHNGFKFGLTDGGVLSGREAGVLVELFKGLLEKKSLVALNAAKTENVACAIDKVNSRLPRYKEDAKAAYLEFTREVIAGSGGGAAEKITNAIKSGVRERPLGIVCDFNGSARTLSIDKEFLSSLGIDFRAVNDKPGEIRHAIVPEGKSLKPCADLLDALREKNPAFILGYVPDCDGDRGNLVIGGDGGTDGNIARPLEAQEVFALACVAELAYMVWAGEFKYDKNGKLLVKAAVAVNDPTSMRIDEIAKAFGVEVFRAEVGEANVVGLARKLREEGYLVRILGEGSAGGNITHPSAVRDPVNTIGAILKLLCIRSAGEKKGLYELWCALSGRPEIYRENFSLSDVISSMPDFVTTGAYSPEAIMKIKTADHSLLKKRYQEIFLKEWDARKDELKDKYGISFWEANAYNGIVEKRDIKDFGEAGKGGLKICFSNAEGKITSSIWMRGSGTEPVFRIMADVPGSRIQVEKDLIEWQRRMLAEADARG